jgi:transketolase
MLSLQQLAEKDDSVVLVVGDLGFSVVEEFEKAFPSRFVNAGIAEQNMMGFAAGLALQGHKPYVYSIANFPTFRSAEQYRNDVDYHNLPVRVVAVGGGVSYGSAGYSHHAVQDFALMRTFPNTSIVAPRDSIELERFMFADNHKSPVYIRIGKGEPSPTNQKKQWDSKGKGFSIFTNGTSTRAVVFSGALGDLPFELAEKLNHGATSHDLISVYHWNRAEDQELKEILETYESLVTLEDHLGPGGFGSFILELTNGSHNRPRVQRSFLSNDVVGAVGSEKHLLDKYLVFE